MTREEAIKFLAQYVNTECYTPLCQEAHRMAVAALREQEELRWIPVTERLPEPWKDVLVYSRYDFCETAVYIGVPGKWRVTWNHGMLDVDSVTHWMPLPEPPKEVE